MAYDIQIRRKNDRTLKIVVSGGSVTSTAGWKLFFTVKKRQHDTDEEAVIKKDVDADVSPSEPENRIIRVVLDKTDTDLVPKTYIYDIKVQDAAGKDQSSQTGNFIILPTTTQRDS